MEGQDGLPIFIDPETRAYMDKMVKQLHSERVNLAVLVNRAEKLADRLEWLWERRGKAHG